MLVIPFDADIAVKYGVNEAIMVSFFATEIAQNNANKEYQHDGKVWCSFSLNAMAQLFPFWSAKQVYRTIRSLIKQGVIVAGNYNKNPYDRTAWYSFSDSTDYRHF